MGLLARNRLKNYYYYYISSVHWAHHNQAPTRVLKGHVTPALVSPITPLPCN